jgi:VanZ family protein
VNSGYAQLLRFTVPPSMSANLPRRALLWYWIFIVYGSFIPFIFNFDPNFVKWRVGIFFYDSLYRGVIHRSWSDIIVNVLVYMPLGILGTATLRRTRWLSHSFVAPLVVGMCGLCTGLAVELGQTLAPYRSPSMLDALCNGFGTLLGAWVGYAALPSLGNALRPSLVRVVRTHLAHFITGFLLLASILGNYYPFIPIVNPRVWWVKFARGLGAGGWPGTYLSWLDIVFDKGLIYGALGFAFHQAMRPSGRSVDLKVGIIPTVAAIFVEIGKIFFIIPRFRVADTLISAGGAFCGATIVPALLKSDGIKSRRYAILLPALVAVLVYFELRPFDWIYTIELPPELRRIEWLPFVSYYSAPPAAAFFDLSIKLMLTLPLGYLIAAVSTVRHSARRASCAAAVTACLAVLLEACQLAIRSRFTSTTDVLV